MTPPPLDPIAAEYVALAFGIERHRPGFVDAYVGPPVARPAGLSGAPPAPAALVARAQALLEQVASAPDDRRPYLTAQTRAMLAVAEQLATRVLPYEQEVRALFDVAAARTPESVYEAAIAELDQLLPGEGTVRERMIDYRRRFEVAPDAARRLIDRILDEARRRTAAFVALPPGEAVEIALVSDKPWSGYNWYLGDARSRVEINTDLPIRANGLVALVCHEAYPGHHTEHALKEALLYRARGWGEFAIQLIHTPEAVIAEGIATLAESLLVADGDLYRWQAEELFPAAGLEDLPGTPEQWARIDAAGRALRSVGANAALLLHTGQIGELDAVAYLQRYGLRDEAEARHGLRFITDPLWRAYVFCYHSGRDLLGRWLEAGPVEERPARFRRLLTEPIYPSLVAGWAAGGVIDGR